VKNPEQVTRIEYMARVESLSHAAYITLDLAPYAFVVPMDHPLAIAVADAKLALKKCEALANQTLKSLKR
jgi:hypothetical protein